MAIIDVGNRKVGKIKPKREVKPKKDIRGAVHRFCKIAMLRIVEFMILIIVVSVLSLIIGSSLIPMLAYDMSSSFGLTQSTNIYVAMASWIFPMLFYTIVIAAVTFCCFKKFFVWLHSKFTLFINKPEKTKETT